MRLGMKRASSPAPARAEGLLVERIEDETVVYDLETKEAHCLKPLAAVVFERCDGKSTVGEIAAFAEQQLGEPVSTDQVAGAVTQLEERGLLNVPLVVLNGDRNGTSRREMLRKAGYTGAAVAAAPLITSLAAPTAAMAASSIATGCAGCGRNPDCVSNHCCQGNPGKSCNQGCCVQDNNSCHVCPSNCGDPPAPACVCTVVASEIPGGCPCICGSPGCVGVPCCPTQNLLCCVQQSPC
jgi:hypothetical protein